MPNTDLDLGLKWATACLSQLRGRPASTESPQPGS